MGPLSRRPSRVSPVSLRTAPPPRTPPASTHRTPVLLALLLLCCLAPPAASAQDAPIPERFATTVSATDLPGGDLTPLFDVSLEQCLASCLRQDQCVAFTYDQRNAACFPKHTIGEALRFEGALSGVITAHDDATLARARDALGAMGFVDATDLEAARRQALGMAERHQADAASEAALLDAARAQPARAIELTGAAVTVADSGAAWLAHARALASAAERDRAHRFDLLYEATSAAVNAALRLDDAERADALVLLARTFEASFRGDAALAAVRLADALRPGVAPELLTRLRERFGFRVLSHDVDATAAPRICVRFSEPLATTRDYAPFVRSDAHGLALDVEDRQLCVTGVVYGERYELTLRSGLPSASGDALPNDVPLDVYVRDRTPSVRFPGSGYVLPAAGPRALPVETVNADVLELRLLRVSDRNLVNALREGSFLAPLSVWDGERFEATLAEEVWSGEARLDGVLNHATTSRLPLDAAGPLQPGVYVLRAAVPAADPYEVPPATQWFLVSDIGVTTLWGSDGLTVVAQRLSDGQSAAGLRVTLLARSNRLLTEAMTDANGRVHVAAALTRGSGAAAPALLLVEGEDDMAVLSLEQSEFDLSDRGVAGRPAPGPLDVYVTTDRGAYRPGETVHVTALVRDARAAAVDGVPLTVRLLRPDGLEYTRRLSQDVGAGGHVIALAIGRDVPRGMWRIDLHADPSAPAVASRTVLVEDFLPERIDVELTLSDGEAIDVRAPPRLLVDVRHAFGPPAAGLPLSGSVHVYPVSQLEGWPGFSFGRLDHAVDAQRRTLTAGLVTDQDGRIEAQLPLERLELEPRPYALDVIATVVDGSSRPVERSLTRTLRPTGAVVGIRPGFDVGDAAQLPENAEATFDLVLVDPDGQAASGELRWQVDRIHTRFQWYSLYGSWRWERFTERQRVAEGVVSVSGGPARIAVPVTWGRHELRVVLDGAADTGASLPFSAGWYAADASRDTPDLLDVSLDAASYAPGDVARVRIVPEGAGVALVSVLSDRVIDVQLVEVAGETTVELPVTDDWGAGAYVSVSLVRPSDGPEHVPRRSLGLAHAAVAPGERALDVTLHAPDAADPRGPLTLSLELADGDVTGRAFATVAAIDLGALTLTAFAPPDPLGHYFDQRRLGVAIRDLYGRLIDAREGALGQVRSGGGFEPSDARGDGPVPIEDVLAFFSGPVAFEDGRAEVTFDLPAFNGTVRVMAVVWSDAAVGQAHADVLVHDPVVLQPSLPRFMTPGDESRLRLELTHVSGSAGEMTLEVSGHGLASAPPSVFLEDGGSAVLEIDLRPTEVGEHRYRIALRTPDGRELTREARLSVLHTDPVTARSTQFVLEPGERSRLGDEALEGFRPGTASATLVAGASAALDPPGLVLSLLGYPYGCTEQIASSLQPLLLAPHTVTRLGLLTPAEVDERLQQGIDRLLTRQGRTGSFGVWGAGGYDLWLDAYVTEVLLRAEAQGARVPAAALRMALDGLRNQVARAGTMQAGATAYAYALYVLAVAGEAAVGDLRYYADVQAERFDTPLAAAQLAAALALYGERERAEAMFARAYELVRWDRDEHGWRDDYGTALRDRAGLLALAAESGSGVVDRVHLASALERRAAVAWLSTQEAAWSLRASVALGAEAQGLSVDGERVRGDLMHLVGDEGVVIANDGERPVRVTLTTLGVPVAAPESGGVGYTIRRSHYALDGTPADLAAVRVGDRLVVLLEVRPDRGVPGGRLMIDDALPAGLEIDGANLLREGDVSALDWLTTHVDVAMTEARSERFLAAVDWVSEHALRLAYVVRAVSPGSFHYPAALVEDMYRPTNRAQSDTGRLTIRP